MKTTAAALVMLIFMACHAVAEDPITSPVSIESLISSLPTLQEREQWKGRSKKERASPEGVKFSEKLKSFSVNCQPLQARLVKGKPLSDYPGLLALGITGPNGEAKPKFLRVEKRGRIGSGDYAGFICLFDQSQNITAVSSLWTPGF